MAATPIDTMAATSGDVVVGAPRRRGKSKAPNFTYDGPVAVIRLELDASDDRVRRRLERQWEAVFRLRRALQQPCRCCRALRLATTPSLSMHMRNDVVRRHDDSVVATMTATRRVAPPQRHRCTR